MSPQKLYSIKASNLQSSMRYQSNGIEFGTTVISDPHLRYMGPAETWYSGHEWLAVELYRRSSMLWWDPPFRMDRDGVGYPEFHYAYLD